MKYPLLQIFYALIIVLVLLVGQALLAIALNELLLMQQTYETTIQVDIAQNPLMRESPVFINADLSLDDLTSVYLAALDYQCFNSKV